MRYALGPAGGAVDGHRGVVLPPIAQEHAPHQHDGKKVAIHLAEGKPEVRGCDVRCNEHDRRNPGPVPNRHTTQTDQRQGVEHRQDRTWWKRRESIGGTSDRGIEEGTRHRIDPAVVRGKNGQNESPKIRRIECRAIPETGSGALPPASRNSPPSYQGRGTTTSLSTLWELSSPRLRLKWPT